MVRDKTGNTDVTIPTSSERDPSVKRKWFPSDTDIAQDQGSAATECASV